MNELYIPDSRCRNQLGKCSCLGLALCRHGMSILIP